jgi:anti-anti-sigma factor
MSVTHAATSQVSNPGTDTDFPSQLWESGTARFAARWGRSGGVIAVHGEIDAANADRFADQLGRCATCCEWLVLDLTDLEFMGTAGFSALQAINARFAKTKVYWVLVPGAAVSRLLNVCDPDSALPMSESVATGLSTVQDPRRLLHLAPQAG